MTIQPGFLKGFVAATAVFVALYGYQAVAGGPSVRETQDDVRVLRDSLEKIAKEISYIRSNGLEIKANSSVPVKVTDDVTVKTGFSDFEVKTK